MPSYEPRLIPLLNYQHKIGVSGETEKDYENKMIPGRAQSTVLITPHRPSQMMATTLCLLRGVGIFSVPEKLHDNTRFGASKDFSPLWGEIPLPNP